MTNLAGWMRDRAEEQHGLIAIRQASAFGAPRGAVRHELARGHWTLATPRVARLNGCPQTPLQELKTLTLDGGDGSAISLRAAGALWRLPGFEDGPLEASRIRGVSGRNPTLGVLHRPRFLPAHHVTTVAGIEVVTLPRTIFDLAPTIHPMRLARLVDTVTGRGPSILPSLHQMLDELAASGRNGITVMREILECRPVGYMPPASNLERRFETILEEAGEPPMRRQVNLGGHEWIGRVDYADEPPLFVAEIQSQTYHTTYLDRRADELRFKRLKAEAGVVEIAPISEELVWHKPAEVVRLVRAGRAKVARTLRQAS